jgi:hypothetical protein
VRVGGGNVNELDLLSSIVSHKDVDLHMRMTAAGILARYRHPYASRHVSKPLGLTIPQTVEDAVGNIARIGTMAANDEISIDEGRDLIDFQKAYIEAKVGGDLEDRMVELEAIVARAVPSVAVTIEQGLPPLPGADVIMPRLDGLRVLDSDPTDRDGDSS